jgi:hypothetical protein
MSITVLNQSHELGVVRCSLKNARHPLSALSFRKHFVGYHLNPESPDAFFVGDVVNDEVMCLAAVTIRSNEMIVKSMIGFSTPLQLTLMLAFCRTLVTHGKYSKVIHLIMEMALCESIVDFEMLQRSGWTGTLTVVKAGDRPTDKTFWWNTMNRQVDSRDLAFIRLEF